MNKFLMTLAFATLIGGSTMAQDTLAGDSPRRAEQLTNQMTTRLKLNADQAAKVKDINTKYAKDLIASYKEHNEARENGTAPGRAADRDKVAEITNKKNAELKTVLTPAQMDEWLKMQSEMSKVAKERIKEHHDKNMQKAQ